MSGPAACSATGPQRSTSSVSHPPLGLGREQLPEALSRIVAADFGDVLPVEVQLAKDDLRQGVPDLLVAPGVEPLGVAQQLQGGQEELPSGVQLGGGVGELSRDLRPLDSQRRQLGLESSLRPVWVTDQIEQAVFLDVQRGQPGRQSLLEACRYCPVRSGRCRRAGPVPTSRVGR